MREKFNHLYLDSHERKLLIHSLVELKNQLIQQGRYAVYKLWCDDNALTALSQKSFCSFLKQNESWYNIEYTNKVNIGGGRYARGFVGIELLQRPFL